MTGLEAAWEKVHGEAARLKPVHLRELFALDPARFDTLSAGLDDMLLDFSKEKIDAPALEALLALARAAGVERQRDAMFAGEPVNTTEGRAALHMALRRRLWEARHVSRLTRQRAQLEAFAGRPVSGI